MKNPTVQASVVLLVDGLGRVCLAQKKQPIHHSSLEITYSLGTWNGYGGKQEQEDRTIFHTAVRELYDETGGVVCTTEDLKLVCRAYFHFKNKQTGGYDPAMSVSFFLTHRWFGKPQETGEMGPPTFFDRDLIPYDNMMPADQFLFKELFAGKYGVYEVLLSGKWEEPNIRLLDEEL